MSILNLLILKWDRFRSERNCKGKVDAFIFHVILLAGKVT